MIFDEADRMLDQGFKPDMDRLVNQFNLPPRESRQTMMFSATFPDAVQRLAGEYLNKDYVFVTVGKVGDANTDITQEVHMVSQHSKRDKLVSILNETGNQRTLIFVELKRNADFLASYLSQQEYGTTSIHG